MDKHPPTALLRAFIIPVILRVSTPAVDWALQLPGSWEDVLVLDDDGFDQFIDVSLARDLVVTLRHRHQCGPKADGQVVGIHHIFFTELR